jgi:hypothetical protein
MMHITSQVQQTENKKAVYRIDVQDNAVIHVVKNPSSYSSTV